MKMQIYCSGSIQEGLGHLYRAAGFAAVAGLSHAVEMIVLAEARYHRLFASLPCTVTLVPTEEAFLEHARTGRPDVAVFDLLAVGADVFDGIAHCAGLTVSICPIFPDPDRLDLLFTRGTAPAGMTQSKVFSGLDFTIMNRFCTPIDEPRFTAAMEEDQLPVMVSFGGTDGDNHTRHMLTLLREVETPLTVWALLGDGYSHSHDELVTAFGADGRHEIVLARTNRSMWRIASNCAVAILSSGLSTVEAVYAGLPVIAVRRSGDPANLVSAAHESDCLDGGSFADGSFRRVRGIIEDVARDRWRLADQRARQRGLVDGLGPSRVLMEIERAVSVARRLEPVS